LILCEIILIIVIIIIYYFCIVIGLPMEKDFVLLHSIHTGCGDHPASYTMSTGGGDFSGDKAAGD
jgi:hypothetical protein